MASTTAAQERSKEAEDLSIEDAGEGLLELLPGDDDLSMEDQPKEETKMTTTRLRSSPSRWRAKMSMSRRRS